MDGVWHKRSWGRFCRERERARRHRSRRGRPSRGDRRGRRQEGGQRQLGAVRPQYDRTRFERRQIGGRRPLRGTGLHGGLDAAEGEVPAVHGAIHTQRALQDAADPPRMGVGGPEGRVRHGVPGIRVGQGRDRRRGDGGQEAEGRRQLPAGGDRRDHDLPAGRVPGRALQAHPHEQHDRTAQPRDQAAHVRRGKLPGREQRAHARLRAHQVRHRERMVQPAEGV